ncbi:hypothetical protein AAMO2058_000829800 [Amorphochlora amoebiformis]
MRIFKEQICNPIQTCRDLSANRKLSRRNQEEPKEVSPVMAKISEVNEMLKTTWGRRERAAFRTMAEVKEMAKVQERLPWKTTLKVLPKDIILSPAQDLPKLSKKPRPYPYKAKAAEIRALLEMEANIAADCIVEDIVSGTKSLFSLTGSYSNSLRLFPDLAREERPEPSRSVGDACMTNRSNKSVALPKPSPKKVFELTNVRILEAEDTETYLKTDDVFSQSSNIPDELFKSTVSMPESAELPKNIELTLSRLSFTEEEQREVFRKRFDQMESQAIVHDGFWWILANLFDRKEKDDYSVISSIVGHSVEARSRINSTVTRHRESVYTANKNPLDTFNKRNMTRVSDAGTWASESQESQLHSDENNRSLIRGAIFNRLSENFVNLFDSTLCEEDAEAALLRGVGSLSSEKDMFFQKYSDALAQTIYYCLCSAYPRSRRYLRGEFPLLLKAVIVDWTVGYEPYKVNISHWADLLKKGETEQEKTMRQAREIQHRVSMRMDNLYATLTSDAESGGSTARRSHSYRRRFGGSEDGKNTARTNLSTSRTDSSGPLHLNSNTEIGQERALRKVDQIKRRTTRRKKHIDLNNMSRLEELLEEDFQAEQGQVKVFIPTPKEEEKKSVRRAQTPTMRPKPHQNKRVPHKIRRQCTVLYHSALMTHFLTLIHATRQLRLKTRTPISRPLGDNSGNINFVGHLTGIHETSHDVTEASWMNYRHACHEHQIGKQKPDQRENLRQVLRLRKLALKESREYARQLGKLYSDRTRMENRPRMKTRKEMAASRKKMAHEARIITSLKATAKAIVRS